MPCGILLDSIVLGDRMCGLYEVRFWPLLRQLNLVIEGFVIDEKRLKMVIGVVKVSRLRLSGTTSWVYLV